MPIKVTIVEDAEIRKDIKDMIDGQFRALVREEVQAEFAKEAKYTINRTLTNDKILDSVKEVFRNILNMEQWHATRLFERYVKAEIEETYRKRLEEQMKTINLEELATRVIKQKFLK